MNMESKQPYLSIITHSRNDNYEGNSLLRLQTTVDNLILQAKKYNLNAELIIVDWNPPHDKPLLKDVLVFKNGTSPLKIRFIVVPPQIHKSYKAYSSINILPVVAVNVGIRRAKGQFIWPTNADLLFSNELIEFLALEKMDKDKFYRVFRYSVNENVLSCNSLEDRLDFCRKNIVQAYQKNIVSIHGLSNHPVLQTACGGDFIVFSKDHWHALHGYPQINNLAAFADWLLCYILYLSGLKEVVLPDTMRVYHMDHKKHQKQREEFSKSIVNFLRYKVYHKMTPTNPLRIIMKYINNLRNALAKFFMSIYYSLVVPMLKKVSAPGRFDVNLGYSYWGFHKLLIEMLKKERPYIYNDENWGMPGGHFQEYEL